MLVHLFYDDEIYGVVDENDINRSIGATQSYRSLTLPLSLKRLVVKALDLSDLLEAFGLHEVDPKCQLTANIFWGSQEFSASALADFDGRDHPISNANGTPKGVLSQALGA
jgi:hypothetical protein